MPHPKRRQSKTRSAKRRTHQGAATPTMTNCSNCGSGILMHRVCPDCGHYRGKLAIEKEVAI